MNPNLRFCIILFATSCCIWTLRMHLEKFWIIYLIHVYRNTVVVKVGMDISSSIAAYLIGWALMLVIICVKTVTIDIFVFICFATIGLTSQWLIIFSIRVSTAILTISLDEIKGKMSKLPINVLYTVIMNEGKLNKLIFGKFLNTMKRYKTSRYRPKHSAFKFLILKSKVWREYDWKHIQHLMVHIFKKFKESHQLNKIFYLNINDYFIYNVHIFSSLYSLQADNLCWQVFI